MTRLPTGQAVRFAWFFSLLGLSAFVQRTALLALVHLSLDDDRYSAVSLIPLVAAGLIAWRRERIFATVGSGPAAGLTLLTLGACVSWFFSNGSPATVEHLAPRIAGLLLLWAGAFTLCFGLCCARRAAFPLCLLFLTVPVPLPYLARLTHFLQYASAGAGALLFRLLGIPALRQGLFFSLPGFDIEIAEQCSGIRSSTALVLASSLAGYLYLAAPANRLLLVAVTIPVVIVRNAIRIVTLSGLAVYVSRGFLFGSLHHYGGLVFSLLDIGILGPLLFRLHHAEERARKRACVG